MTSDRMRLPGRWYRLPVTLPMDLEDEVAGLLGWAGAGGVLAQPAGPGRIRLEAWFDSAEAAREAIEEVRPFEGVEANAEAIEAVEDDGWLEKSLQPLDPFDVGPFRIIEQTSQSDPKHGLELIVPRSRAFGTGSHETTAMCLELLATTGVEGRRVVDLGCGSAILAIGAARLGAKDVLAIDNDPQVMEVAQENLEFNDVEASVRLEVGSTAELRDRSIDLLVANIHKTAIERAASSLAASMGTPSVAVLSGFVTQDAEAVQSAWEKHGFSLHTHATRGEWSALMMERR